MRDVHPHAGGQFLIVVHDAVERGAAGSAGARSLAAMSDDLACWICGADAAPDTRYAGLPLVRCRRAGSCSRRSGRRRSSTGLYTTDYFDAYGGQAYDADEVQRRHEARSG